MNSQSTLYAGLEAGGTKFVCLVASGPDDIRAQARFPTGPASETLARVIEFFETIRNPFFFYYLSGLGGAESLSSIVWK